MSWTCPRCGRVLDARAAHTKLGSLVQCRPLRMALRKVKPLTPEELVELEGCLASEYLPENARVWMIRLLKTAKEKTKE